MFLTAGNQIYENLKLETSIQKDYADSKYLESLRKASLSNVCLEPIVLMAGQTYKEASKAKEKACIWARNKELNLKQYDQINNDIKAYCSGTDDRISYGVKPTFNQFEACKNSKINTCARAHCEYDKKLSSIMRERYEGSIPNDFKSNTLDALRLQLERDPQPPFLSPDTSKALRPISPGYFTQIWIFVFAIALGLRLAKAIYDLTQRAKKAYESKQSWFRPSEKLKSNFLKVWAVFASQFQPTRSAPSTREEIRHSDNDGKTSEG